MINKTLNLELEENEIEKYKENYIIEKLINKETDIVYKIKDKKVFILIEHQTKIDYSMPYRIMEYQYKITESAIDKNKLKQKGYKIPTVISIVLYTGRKKWNVKEYIKEVQESFYQYNGSELGKYNIVDVNDYTEEELLNEKTFLSKAMLIESKSNSSDIIECLDKIIEVVNSDERYSQKQRKLLLIMLDIILRTKINNNNETNRLMEKVKIGGEDKMLALVDNIKRENRRLISQGRREGRTEIIKNMKLENLPLELIIKITGLSKEEIEKL